MKLTYVGFNCDFLNIQTYKNGLFIKECEIVKEEDGKIFYKRNGETGIKKINLTELNIVKDFGTSMYVITTIDSVTDQVGFENYVRNIFNSYLDKRIDASIKSKDEFNKLKFER